MKKSLVVMLAVTISMVLTVASVQARWNNDPGNDPVYKQFLEDTADIRKQIAMERAELNALMTSENPDPVQVRDLSASIADNEQKFIELARVNGFGGTGGCGGARTAQGSCGSCGNAANTDGQVAGGSGSCGTPGCPGAVVGQ